MTKTNSLRNLQHVARLSDGAIGRVESVTRTEVVVDLGYLGAKVMSRREFQAEFAVTTAAAVRRDRQMAAFRTLGR